MAITPINIALPTGELLALWNVSEKCNQKDKHVFLTHGTFSSKKVCLLLATYLAEHGYNCWILEWRNHGDSFRTQVDYNFETIAKEDIKAALDYLIYDQQIKQLDVITHSGGGLCITIALLTYPTYQQYIHSLTLMACQATQAASNWGKRLRLQLSKALCKILGYIPAKVIGGEYDEPYAFMKQWFDWNLTKRFHGNKEQDFQKAMASIPIPVLAIAGKGDTFIAPAQGCEEFLGFFQNPENIWLYAAKETGFLEDYTHGRIIHSRSAYQDIYPRILKWIERES